MRVAAQFGDNRFSGRLYALELWLSGSLVMVSWGLVRAGVYPFVSHVIIVEDRVSYSTPHLPLASLSFQLLKLSGNSNSLW